MIDSGTRLYGLVGNPVAGTRSPWIHNTVFEQLAINGAYLAFAVEEKGLADAVRGLKALGVRGFNVTIPFKTEILPLLDRVDPLAARLGAVNTVVSENGALCGFNTDGPGLAAVLGRHLGSLKGLRVLVLGAGGAARGICGALLEAGVAELALLNRSQARAEALVQEMGVLAGEGQVLRALDPEAGLQPYGLVINTTSVGMEPLTDAVPVALTGLASGAAVCDIVYKPHRTRLLQEARAAGHPVIHGIEMLIEQALLAQKLWHGITDGQLAALRHGLIAEFERFDK